MLDPTEITEGNDSVENEESVEYEEEQQEVESQDTSGILQDLSSNRKITVTLPAPIDPKCPGISREFRDFWLHRPSAPPAGFAQMNGRSVCKEQHAYSAILTESCYRSHTAAPT